MHIGVPREIKPLEGRVGLVPDACSELVAAGHELFVETGAGVPSGYPDAQYRAAGVTICDSAKSLYASAELIVKVKEPVEGDLDLLRREHILFSYLHLAAAPELMQRLLSIGLTAIAFETVQDDSGFLLLLFFLLLELHCAGKIKRLVESVPPNKTSDPLQVSTRPPKPMLRPR